MMDHEKQAKRAEKVRAYAEAYMTVVRRMEAELILLQRIKLATGEYPENSLRIIRKLQREGKSLNVRILRMRADMIEATLDTFAETEIPNNLPDGLPEDW